MEWFSMALSFIGAIGGAGGIISIYTAKAKRDGVVTDSMKKIIDEAQEERETLRKEHNDYKEETNNRIRRLEEHINLLEQRDIIKVRAINSAYRCGFPASPKECPVIRTLDEECAKNEGICKIK